MTAQGLGRAVVVALAAGSNSAAAAEIDGAALGLSWILPFAGILLSIALMPLLAPLFWHHNYGKIAAGWALMFVLPFAALHGFGSALHLVAHTAFLEYLPFIILLLALFTVSGGIEIKGNLHGSPVVNTTFLGCGTLLASWTGTTGAAMLLIRPLLRANDGRRYNVHVVVFFVFLVANIGGSLTPLGDPPLFLGFLKGVSFFWTTIHLAVPMLVSSLALLVVFYFLDRHFYRKETDLPPRPDPTPASGVSIGGWRNVLLLAAIVGAVLMSGVWRPGVTFSVFGTELELQNIARDALLLAIAGLSCYATPQRIHEANQFGWAPIKEVAKLFAGIFVTIIPAIAILRSGGDGALAPLVALVTGPQGQPLNAAYFWLTGILSSFLDNAPTYLVFFNLAGGDAQQLMGPLADTLTAISAGAVFMGANTYIGNAPNFMVKAIAEERGVKMPSFFGYMAWSLAILVPLFLLLTLIFFGEAGGTTR
ncbi:MAG TPA: sodium:proton antiporter [Burkholderiales bacterium]|nr:sodium:proton antiporter [Burkholderiales bacterium]